jgi:COMPASS component SWD3
LWNYVDGKCLKTYQGHRNEKFSISGAFGIYGDGTQCFAVSGSEDGSIVLWDVTSKEILQRMEGHEGVVFGVDTRERKMVSGGTDGTVRIWEQEDDDDSDGEEYGTPAGEPPPDADVMEE